MDTQKFYESIRAQIVHEDDLCNQRMTWMIALQAFLFTAYGFSLSAEGAVTPPKDLSGIINSARTGFAVAGMLIPIPVLASLWAAVRSIGKLVDRWHANFSDEKAACPQIIGNHDLNRTRGTMLGQTPLFAIPLLLSGVWLYIGIHTELFLKVGLWIAVGTLITSLAFSAGFYLARYMTKA